jgi:hypothetical protein
MNTDNNDIKAVEDAAKWVCNECGFSDYTDVISENDLTEYLQCSNCGGNEFHRKIENTKSTDKQKLLALEKIIEIEQKRVKELENHLTIALKKWKDAQKDINLEFGDKEGWDINFENNPNSDYYKAKQALNK